ncbi:MAG: hypothetical protein AAF631_09810, partial [Pseudomonadota bacterium]
MSDISGPEEDEVVIDGTVRGTLAAPEFRDQVRKNLEEYSRVTVKDCTITVEDDGYIDLGNMAYGHADVEFDNCNFLAPLVLSGSDFARVSFKNCEFALVDPDEGGDGKRHTSRCSVLLADMRARGVDFRFNEEISSSLKRVFSLDAHGCEVSGTFRVHRGKHINPSPLHLSLESMRIGQAGFGGDLLIDDDTNGNLILHMNRVRVRGDFIVVGNEATNKTRVALNASDLRVAEEMRLRNVTFLNVEHTPQVGPSENRPAVNLTRASIGRLVLHEKVEDLFPKNAAGRAIKEHHFNSRNQLYSNAPGLGGISVDRVGFLGDTLTREK